MRFNKLNESFKAHNASRRRVEPRLPLGIYEQPHHDIMEARAQAMVDTYLVEAAVDRYRKQIANVEPLSQYPGMEDVYNNLNADLEWAMDTLGRNDRIIWFMRYAKFLRLTKEAAPSVANLDDEGSQYFTKVLRNSSKFAPNVPASVHWDINAIKKNLEHYMMIPAHNIRDFVFDKQSPSILFNMLNDEEKTWKAKQAEIVHKSENDVNHQGDQVAPTEVIDFEDGHGWFNLNVSGSENEARCLGHCGNGRDSAHSTTRVFSLRQHVNNHGKAAGGEHATHWKPILTFTIDNGKVVEMKGRGNDKPSKKYWKYIIPLLMSEYVDSVAGGGYLPQNNFSVLDLPENIQQDILSKKPNLVSIYDYISRHDPEDDSPDSAFAKQIKYTSNVFGDTTYYHVASDDIENMVDIGDDMKQLREIVDGYLIDFHENASYTTMEEIPHILTELELKHPDVYEEVIKEITDHDDFELMADEDLDITDHDDVKRMIDEHNLGEHFKSTVNDAIVYEWEAQFYTNANKEMDEAATHFDEPGLIKFTHETGEYTKMWMSVRAIWQAIITGEELEHVAAFDEAAIHDLENATIDATDIIDSYKDNIGFVEEPPSINISNMEENAQPTDTKAIVKQFLDIY